MKSCTALILFSLQHGILFTAFFCLQHSEKLYWIDLVFFAAGWNKTAVRMIPLFVAWQPAVLLMIPLFFAAWWKAVLSWSCSLFIIALFLALFSLQHGEMLYLKCFSLQSGEKPSCVWHNFLQSVEKLYRECLSMRSGEKLYCKCLSLQSGEKLYCECFSLQSGEKLYCSRVTSLQLAEWWKAVSRVPLFAEWWKAVLRVTSFLLAE